MTSLVVEDHDQHTSKAVGHPHPQQPQGKLKVPRSQITQTQSQNQKRMVSFDVFMKYVRFSPNGDVDVGQIFSEGCFSEWVANRKKRPKEPEESFRKALVAHVSGKDDRKPFPEDVEMMILKRLRESEPWPCFQASANGASKIGERGLKKSSLGFHESKRRKLSASSSGKQIPHGPPTKKFFPAFMSPTFSPLQRAYMDNSPESLAIPYQMPIEPSHTHSPIALAPFQLPQGFNPNGFSPNDFNGINGFGFRSIPFNGYNYGAYPNDYVDEKIEDRRAQDDEKSRSRRCLAQVLARSMYSTGPKSSSLCKSLSKFYSVDQLTKLFQKSAWNGQPVLTENILDEMDSGTTELSPWCKDEFLFPDVQQVNLNITKPIGNITSSSEGIISDVDDTTTKIFKKSLVGHNFFSCIQNPLERALWLRGVLEASISCSRSLSRTVVVVDRVAKVLMVEILLTVEKSFKIRIQDVSDAFHDVIVKKKI